MVEPTWFQEIVGIASGILTLAACAAMIGVIVLAFYLAGAARRARSRLAAMEGIPQLLTEVRHLVGNLNAAVGALREDMVAIRGTVAAANDGAREVVRRVEDRVRRLDAVVEVAQTEVEETLLSAVATARSAREMVGELREYIGLEGRSRGPLDRRRAPLAKSGLRQRESRTGGGDDPDVLEADATDSAAEEAGDGTGWPHDRDGGRNGGKTGHASHAPARPRRRGR